MLSTLYPNTNLLAWVWPKVRDEVTSGEKTEVNRQQPQRRPSFEHQHQRRSTQLYFTGAATILSSSVNQFVWSRRASSRWRYQIRCVRVVHGTCVLARAFMRHTGRAKGPWSSVKRSSALMSFERSEIRSAKVAAHRNLRQLWIFALLRSASPYPKLIIGQGRSLGKKATLQTTHGSRIVWRVALDYAWLVLDEYCEEEGSDNATLSRSLQDRKLWSHKQNHNCSKYF